MITALRVFLPFALAYLVAYLLRVVNAVAGAPISDELGLTTAQLGFLTSVYLFTFALCQLPFGVLLDRYGPRKVEAATLLLAAAGCALFVVATGFGELVLGRALMGVGASMCLMAPFTAFRRWFTADRLPLVVGLHMTFGAIGSALGGAPSEALIEWVGWRELFAILSGAVVLSSALILFVVPPKRENTPDASFQTMLREVGGILVSRSLLRIAPLSATSQAGFLAIVSLWTGPWLREVAGLSPAAAADWLSISSIGLIAGFLGYGWIAARAERAGHGGSVFGVGAALSAGVIALIIVLPPALATPLWPLYTIVGTAGVLSYAIAARAFAPELAGRVNTALNFVVFFFAFLIQWAFGVVLELFPDGAGGSTRLGYQVALGSLLALQVAAFIPYWLMRDTGLVAAGSAAQ